jgi:hypothetical protein
LGLILGTTWGQEKKIFFGDNLGDNSWGQSWGHLGDNVEDDLGDNVGDIFGDNLGIIVGIMLGTTLGTKEKTSNDVFMFIFVKPPCIKYAHTSQIFFAFKIHLNAQSTYIYLCKKIL